MTESIESEAWLEGGCHCGAVRFRVRPSGRRVLECNCSICAMKGFLGLIVPPDDFEILEGAEGLDGYRFNTRVAEHCFCRVCGIHPFSRPRSHRDSFDVNLRCLDAGTESFEIVPFDGQNWEENVASIRKASSTSFALVWFGIVSMAAIVIVSGCNENFITTGPSQGCREVAAQCVLPDGPLGVCEQIPCAQGEGPSPCLICTSQH